MPTASSATGPESEPSNGSRTSATPSAAPYIPGNFNTDKDKLFFFWSQEFVRRRSYPGHVFCTTPTQLERNGDFSKTRDVNGA